MEKPKLKTVKIKSKEQFLADQIETRKSKIRKEIEQEYGSQFVKRRKSRINEFKNTKAYQLQVNAAYAADKGLKKLEDRNYLDAEYQNYVSACESNNAEYKEKYDQEMQEYLHFQEIWEKVKSQIDEYDPIGVLSDEYEQFLLETRNDLINKLLTGIVSVDEYYYNRYGDKRYTGSHEVTKDNIDEFCSDFAYELDSFEDAEVFRSEKFWELQEDSIADLDHLELDKDSYRQIRKEVEDYFDNINEEFWEDHLLGEGMYDGITEDFVRQCLEKNPHYSWIYRERREEEAQRQIVSQALLTKIPENFIDLFPAARKMHRKFMLHIGPTNSGKTHDALEDLMHAKNGVYLAPLRLLAYEGYEKLNTAGVPCKMVTGEEELLVENAMHISSTIEMANLSEHYDVAVIDEAQMIADEFRGGSWTNAILGLQADVIHICMAEYAKDIVISLIESCGDAYQVIEHHRDTPLEPDYTLFSFPQDVQKGDALIVFSRRDVFYCAAEAQDAGLKCSVVYGALPYDARRHEVDRFLYEETDVVIATDAIGMGMNLPIKRIVFLKIEKYDGKNERELKPEEVQQIAGRAGRKGLYGRGSYTAEFGAKKIRKKIEKTVPPVSAAVIRFPRAIVGIEGKLSSIIEQWMALPDKPGYKKADSKREQRLAENLEEKSTDKMLIYRFVTLTFDEKNEEVYDVWEQLFDLEIRKAPIINPLSCFGVFTHKITSEEELMVQEVQYKKCDLLFQYAKNFEHPELTDEIMKMKNEISDNIKDFLSHQKFKLRKCKYCGKPLKWNYPYGMCSECHNEMYPPRYNRWDDWDDDEFNDDEDFDEDYF